MRAKKSQTLRDYLQIHDLTADEFADLSGMPRSEVNGILQGELRITKLRANHLAAVFNTDPAFWTDRNTERSHKASVRVKEKAML